MTARAEPLRQWMFVTTLLVFGIMASCGGDSNKRGGDGGGEGYEPPRGTVIP